MMGVNTKSDEEALAVECPASWVCVVGFQRVSYPDDIAMQLEQAYQRNEQNLIDVVMQDER